MPFVSAPDGIRLHYDLEGEGPPLVLHLGAGCDSVKEAADTRIRSLRAEGWDWLINAFAKEEGKCPEWMRDRIRATDREQMILWQSARLDWKTTPWDLVVNAQPPALILVGDLEDPEHLMTEAAAQMRDATEVRFEGVGHINGFLASDRQLPHVEAFLTKH